MRIINVGFIGLFILMLTLPLIFVDLSSDRVSVQENRVLANPPKLAYMKNDLASFIWQFEFWFKDSTGFREQLLAINKSIGLNNATWYIDGRYTYLIGEQGHRYFADENGRLILKFQGKKFLSDEQLQNMAVKLENVKTYLDSRGIPLVVMFCTDKETIYPEFYPKLFTHGPEPVQLDVITVYLQEHTNADVFNVRRALLAEKENYLLYDISEDIVHHNEVGAFFAYRELMKHINIHFSMMVPYGLDDIEISYDKAGRANVSLKTESKYHKLDQSFFDDVTLSVRPFTWENVAYENTESDFVILFLQDSNAGYYFPDYYKEFLHKYIPQHFGKAIFIHYQNIRNLEEYINRYKPDIVVFESTERILGDFADHVTGIPELPLIIATR